MYDERSQSAGHANSVEYQECCENSPGADSDEQWLPHDRDGRSSCKTNALGWSALSAPAATSQGGKGSEVDCHSVDDDGGAPACNTHRCAEKISPPKLSRVGTPTQCVRVNESGVSHGGVQPGRSDFGDGSSRSGIVLPDSIPDGSETCRDLESALTADDWFETTYALLSQTR